MSFQPNFYCWHLLLFFIKNQLENHKLVNKIGIRFGQSEKKIEKLLSVDNVMARMKF